MSKQAVPDLANLDERTFNDLIKTRTPEWTDGRGRTPLHEAVRRGRLDVVDALINTGASVMAQDQYGNSPLHTAVVATPVNEGIVQLIADAGSDWYLPNLVGVVPIMLTDVSSVETVSLRDYLDDLRILLRSMSHRTYLEAVRRILLDSLDELRSLLSPDEVALAELALDFARQSEGIQLFRDFDEYETEHEPIRPLRLRGFFWVFPRYYWECLGRFTEGHRDAALYIDLAFTPATYWSDYPEPRPIGVHGDVYAYSPLALRLISTLERERTYMR